MPFMTKCWKIETRTSNGMAKEMILRIPGWTDIAAIWRLERILGLCVPGFESCCDSRLNRRYVRER